MGCVSINDLGSTFTDRALRLSYGDNNGARSICNLVRADHQRIVQCFDQGLRRRRVAVYLLHLKTAALLGVPGFRYSWYTAVSMCTVSAAAAFNGFVQGGTN